MGQFRPEQDGDRVGVADERRVDVLPRRSDVARQFSHEKEEQHLRIRPGYVLKQLNIQLENPLLTQGILKGKVSLYR